MSTEVTPAEDATEVFSCTPEDIDGVDNPEAFEALTLDRLAVHAPEVMRVPLTFRFRGPGRLKNTSPTRRTTSDGATVVTEWEYPWFAGFLQHEANREDVRRWLTWCLQHSSSFVRAGIWFPEAAERQFARAVYQYVEDGFRCGSVAEARGCTTPGGGPDSRHDFVQDLIRIGRLALATPENPQGFFKGVLHETLHSFGRCGHGPPSSGYRGIMHGAPKGIWPTEGDIADVVAFTRGQNKHG